MANREDPSLFMFNFSLISWLSDIRPDAARFVATDAVCQFWRGEIPKEIDLPDFFTLVSDPGLNDEANLGYPRSHAWDLALSGHEVSTLWVSIMKDWQFYGREFLSWMEMQV